MRAYLVAKNELGEETLKSIGESYSDDDGKWFVISQLSLLISKHLSYIFFSVERKSSTPLPDYLPEDDVPTENSDKALAPHGITEVASNWISSAATFLQRSFYW